MLRRKETRMEKEEQEQNIVSSFVAKAIADNQFQITKKKKRDSHNPIKERKIYLPIPRIRAHQTL